MTASNVMPVDVLLLIAAAILAYAFGRHAKKQEFRFNLLGRATTIYFKALMAIGDYRRAIGALQRIASSPASSAENPHVAAAQRAEALESCLADAASISYLIERLFSAAVKKHWAGMAINFMRVRHQRPGLTDHDVQALVETAHSEWKKFVEAASRRCGFYPWERWWRRFRFFLRAGQDETLEQSPIERDRIGASLGDELLRSVLAKVMAGSMSHQEAAQELIQALSSGALSADDLVRGYLDYRYCPKCRAEVKIEDSYDTPDGGGHTVACTKCPWTTSVEY